MPINNIIQTTFQIIIITLNTIMSNPMKHTTTPQKADGNSERGGCGVAKPRAFEEEINNY